MNHPFNDTELLTIFELALSCTDAELFEYIQDKLDMSDEEMKELSDKLYTFMTSD